MKNILLRCDAKAIVETTRILKIQQFSLIEVPTINGTAINDVAKKDR